MVEAIVRYLDAGSRSDTLSMICKLLESSSEAGHLVRPQQIAAFVKMVCSVMQPFKA